MAAGKEIRTKIKSVKNTQKITKAMEMVAASKMRKAQERMRSARPYGEKIREVCAHLARANSEARHPFLQKPAGAQERGGLILVTTDKGLCGGLNANIMRLAVSQLREWEGGGGGQVAVFGSKGAAFMARIGADVKSRHTGYGDAPDAGELIGAVKVMMDAYRSGEISEVRLMYTKFVNTVAQTPTSERLLPISDEALGEEPKRVHAWDYLYEPEAAPIVDALLTRFVEALVYQAVAENIASEQAARMVAMKAASDNAGNLIDELQLIYNKSRQAAITQEIAEIVGGASAV